MKIPAEVRKVLESGLVVEGERVVITAKLDRGLYTLVNKTLEALGGKWNRFLKAHVFPGDIGSAIEQTLIRGEVTTDKDLGFFPTPEGLAEEMAEFVCVRAGMDVLEPSAGEGALVRAVLRRGAVVTALEFDDVRREALKKTFHSDCVNVLSVRDFMDLSSHGPGSPEGGFEGIIANPPFCKVGQGDHIAHLLRMLFLLAPKGRLACIMPASLVFRQDQRHKAVRTAIEDEGGTITELPDGSFKSAGTSVNTCVVKIAR